MRTARLLLGVLPLCLLSLACSAVQKPSVSVKSMTVRDLKAEGFVMNFDTEVTNPNPVALPLSDVDYGVKLGGAKLLDGKAKPAGTLPANGSMNVAVPVTVTFQNLLAVSDVLSKGGGNVPYTLDGGFSFSSGQMLGQSVRVPVSYSGTLELAKLLKDPAVLLRSAAARQLAEKVIGVTLPK